MSEKFEQSGIPELVFGRGRFEELPERILPFGLRVLLVIDGFLDGHPSLLKEIKDMLSVKGLAVQSVNAKALTSEGAAEIIMQDISSDAFDCVVSLGGGRAIDTGKLVARSCPHIALPTTAGTGAPMNGIIFGGTQGHEETYKSHLLPDVVIADPSFIDEMARDDFASRALAVMMLLIEAYVAPKASVLSDALVWSGLERFTRGFLSGLDGDQDGRDDVFYSALMAGVGSGQAGFGLVHRTGAIIEQKTDLTYAQACSCVAAELTDLQIRQLSDILPDSLALDKYAMVGELIAGRPFEDREEAYASLIGTLRRWVSRLDVPKFEISDDGLEEVASLLQKDWDDQVLAIHLSEDDLLDALSRRQL